MQHETAHRAKIEREASEIRRKNSAAQDHRARIARHLGCGRVLQGKPRAREENEKTLGKRCIENGEHSDQAGLSAKVKSVVGRFDRSVAKTVVVIRLRGERSGPCGLVMVRFAAEPRTAA